MQSAVSNEASLPIDQRELPLTIFVHRASECLTDHLPHGDGLICFSLLSELARRGHRVIAYTNRSGVNTKPQGLDIREQTYKVPANSLGDWELGLRANRLLKHLEKTESIDIVWRMHPYEASSPIVPYTNGRPLVIGPLFKSWPAESVAANDLGKPRFGIGIRGLLAPLANRGWARALRKAALVLCATDSLAEEIRPKTDGNVMTLPVIVDPPVDLAELSSRNTIARHDDSLRLVFAANLYRNKNPLVFCETIAELRSAGIHAIGIVIGDGPERSAMESFCQANHLTDAVLFKGRLPNSEVYSQLALADGLISTSFGEPYGRGIAEAMSVGTMPICHNSGGPADFITHNIDGLLIDRIDAKLFAQSIANVWKIPGMWARFSVSAKEKATQWTTRVVVDQLESALLALLPKVASR